ncbi:MAG: MarR family transcriptional regulator [Candidatus Dormibacteraeota bacterium]|nr:MarR family transcriptional regulator [Candidatus Dormibacteraeota bacterium]
MQLLLRFIAMVELVSPAGVAAWQTFLKAHAAAVGRIEIDFEDRGLIPLVWYDVLVAIQLAPDHRLRMMELAGALMLTRSNATRLVDRLETVGLIVRERLDGDRRGTVAVLTAAGRQALRRAWPVYARGINEYFLTALSSGELRTLAAALGKVQQQKRPVRPALKRRTSL